MGATDPADEPAPPDLGCLTATVRTDSRATQCTAPRAMEELNVAAISPSQRYVSAVVRAAATDLGREIPVGTTVVGSPSREGSTAAVAYPLVDRTVIWCAPAKQPRLAALEGDRPLSADEFVANATALGGTVGGYGHHRVLDGPAQSTDSRRLMWLDRAVPADVALIARFAASCSEDDLDEAELDLEDLDPTIAVILADDGSVVSYASGRPWSFDPDFDDIAVITHPQCRRRGLGAAVVAGYAAAQQARGRLQFYNCGLDNVGSNRIAQAAGFTVVTTVVAVGF